MPKRRSVDLHYPVGGLDRSASFQQQGPYTTNSAENMRTRDPFDARNRGGPRPGLVDTFPSFSSDRIDMLNTVTYVPVNVLGGRKIANETFNQGFDLNWVPWNFTNQVPPQLTNQPPWPGRDGLPLFGSNAGPSGDDRARKFCAAQMTGTLNPINTWKNSVGAVNTEFFRGLSPATTISELRMTFGPDYFGAFNGGYYYPPGVMYSLFFNMEEADAIGLNAAGNVGRDLLLAKPNSGYGLHAIPVLTSDDTQNIFFILEDYTGFGSYDILSGITESNIQSGQITTGVLVNPTNKTIVLTVWNDYLGTIEFTDVFDVGSIGSYSGTSVGFNIKVQDSHDDRITIYDGQNPFGTQARLLNLYMRASGPDLTTTEVAGAPKTVIVAASGDKLWRYPNPDESVSSTTFEPVENTPFNSDIVKLPSDEPFTPSVKCASVEFFQKLYIINPNQNSWSGKLLQYDPQKHELAVCPSGATDGNGNDIPIPQWNTSIARFLGRVYLAGDKAAPHVWYASRQGGVAANSDGTFPDGLDFYYDVDTDDVQAAVASINSDTGTIGEPITSMVPSTEDYMVFSGRESLHVLRGDPRQGGRLDSVSSTIGFMSRDAWCFSPDMMLFIMTNKGLYVIPPNANGYPQSVSTRKVPKELIADDNAEKRVVMSFDVYRNGINIFIANSSDQSAPNGSWFYSLTHDAFWPERLAPAVFDKSITCQTSNASEFLSDNANTLFGFKDGSVRHYRDGVIADGGDPFTSYVVYGPIRVGRSDRHEGIFHSLQAKLPEGSGAVRWSILTGGSATEALASTEAASGVWFGGRNIPSVVRLRCNTAYVAVASGFPFTIEDITVWLQTGGMQRHIKTS